MRNILIVLALIFSISACASKTLNEIPAEVSMKKGQELFDRKKYAKAAEEFEAAIRNARTPELAGSAQLMLADSHFFDKSYNLAIPSYETFLRIYPFSPEASRAKLRLGLCYYRQLDSPDRDMKNTEEALRVFLELRNQNPAYAKEFELDEKIVELRGLMAERELIIAKFYFRTYEERAAVRRLQYIITNYPDTDIYPESLLLLGNYYADREGYESEAIKYYRAIIREFPNTKYSSSVTGKLSKLLPRITNETHQMEMN